MLVAGIDCSTQSTKSLRRRRRTAARSRARARRRTSSAATGGARESDPRQWWSALAARARPDGPRARGRCDLGRGQQHGLVVLDARRASRCGPAPLWNDTTQRARRRGAGRRARRARGLGASGSGSVPVDLVHRHQVGRLRRVEPGRGGRGRRRPAATRLSSPSGSVRRGGHRPRRRVGDAAGVSPARDAYDDERARAAAGRPRSVAAAAGRARPASRSGGDAPRPRGAWVCRAGARVAAGHGRQHGDRRSGWRSSPACRCSASAPRRRRSR